MPRPPDCQAEVQASDSVKMTFSIQPIRRGRAQEGGRGVSTSRTDGLTFAHPLRNPPEFCVVEVDAPQSAKAGGVAVSGLKV